MDGESGFCLRDIQRDIKQDFGCGCKPILTIMTVRKSPGLEQLVGATCDQFIDLLCSLKEWVACKERKDFRGADKCRCGLTSHVCFSFRRNFAASLRIPSASLRSRSNVDLDQMSGFAVAGPLSSKLTQRTCGYQGRTGDWHYARPTRAESAYARRRIDKRKRISTRAAGV